MTRAQLDDVMRSAKIEGLADDVWVAINASVLLGTLALKVPSTKWTGVALLLRLYSTWTHFPIIFDMFYWSFQLDAGLLLLLLCSSASRESLAAWWAETIRLQLALFYLACAFWKLNTSFLTPRVSCAPVFFLTLLPTLGFTPPAAMARLILQAAPYATIAGEGLIGVFLLAPSARARRAGVGLALLLHYGIAMTPQPNNAVPFSTMVFAARARILYPHNSHHTTTNAAATTHPPLAAAAAGRHARAAGSQPSQIHGAVAWRAAEVSSPSCAAACAEGSGHE